MKVAFQIDDVKGLNYKTDSSLPLILESQKRNNKNFYFIPSSLTYKKNSLYASAAEIKFINNRVDNFIIGKNKSIKLENFEYIFIRQDPPYNMEYLSSLHMLEQIVDKVKIINNPRGIRNAPEKISMLKYKDIIPPTIVTRSEHEIENFMKKHPKAIIKPLYGNGGDNIFFLDKNDLNYNQIIEQFLNYNEEPFIIQKFLPEIKNGDKRIILVNGEPVAAIRRVPKINEIRSNIHVGGSVQKVKINAQDKLICNSLKEFLLNEGLFFVGIDVIGNFLTEINVTSPTCIQEIKNLYKIDIAKIIWEKLLTD